MSELVENQRFYGLSWGAPIPLFDPPYWSSLHGTSHAPSVDGEGGWFVVRLPSTDDDGWVYGSSFSHLNSGRPGGRASKRGSDQVRKRVWRRLLIVNQDEQKKVVDATDIMAEAAAAVIGAPSPSWPKDSHPQIFSPERRSLPSPSPHSPGYPQRSSSLTSSRPHSTTQASSSSFAYSPTQSMGADKRRVTASGLLSVATSTTKGMSSGEAIIEALTETIEARRHRVKGGGSPVLQLSKGIVSLWNESARRHGVLRLFPLDPIGLVLAMKQHTEYASTIKRDLLEGGRNGREPLVMIQSSNLLAAAEEGEGYILDPPLSPSSPFESSTSQPEEPITPQLLLSDPCNTRRLLAELICATDYSRAAYGYVMAAGHMKSIPDLIKMISGSAFFNPVSGASAEANNEAIESITGIPTLDLLKCEWRNSSFRPCHFLAVDRARGRLVLSIRGSLEVGDLCTDLEAQSQPFHLLPLASQASEAIDSSVGQKGPEVQVHHVHRGLLSAALFVAASTSSALTHATEGEYNGWPLIISGHSLGAGVASLLTLMLRNRQDYEEWGDRESGEDQDAEIDDEDRTKGSPSSPPPHPSLDLLASIPLLPRSCHIFCICIAPPPTLSVHLARQSQSCILSLVHGMDFVSRLSHHSVELALMDMVQSSPAVKLAGNLMQGLEDGKAAVSALSVEGKAALTNLSKEGREAVSAILGPKGTAVLSALENEGAAVLSAMGEEGRAALLALGEEGKAAWSVLSSSIKESVKAIKEVAATSSQSRRVTRGSGEGGEEGEDADWEFKRWLKSSPAAVLASSPPSSTTRQIEDTSPPPDALNPRGAQGGSGDDLRKASGSRTFSRWESIVGTMTGWLEDVFEITDDPGTRKKEETRATSTSGPAADSTTITPIDVQMEDLSPLIPPLAKALEKEIDATIEDLERAVTSRELEEEGGDRLLESAVIKAEETIIKEAEKKMATKLYLPGVILWMFKEDKSKAEGKGDGSLRRSHSSNDESEEGASEASSLRRPQAQLPLTARQSEEGVVGLDEEVDKAAEATEKVAVATKKVAEATEKVAVATENGDFRLCLAQADRECFNKLALVDSCITDHMPDSYKSLLVELRQGVHQNQGVQKQ